MAGVVDPLVVGAGSTERVEDDDGRTGRSVCDFVLVGKVLVGTSLAERLSVLDACRRNSDSLATLPRLRARNGMFSSLQHHHSSNRVSMGPIHASRVSIRRQVFVDLYAYVVKLVQRFDCRTRELEE